MGAFTTRSLRFFLPLMILGVCHAGVGAVAHLWFGKDSERRRDSRLGHRDQSDREGTPAGKRKRQGRRATFHAEVRGMPRGDRVGWPGSHADQAAKPLRRLLRIACRLASMRET